ncbi:NUDIX hydrolase [Sediminibacillus albus]|uniref:ADP-ribose pyrophosphatase n=1 Tax=Sediminibacillus albus TaxID=407036 RepID=A0A1G8WEF0_9BACI|nr:NUDIX hydrolase [Sediminibacillus albus]SDJ76739.1 ADP-ribose pyrophosphatase [Sediminibacillus albus]
MSEEKSVIDKGMQQIITNRFGRTYLLSKEQESVVLLAKYREEFILIKQYREPVDDLVIQLPGGGVNPGEDLETAAKREFQEETGYLCGDIRYLGEMYGASWISNEITHVFYSEDIGENIGQSLEQHEHIEVIRVEEQECLTKVRDNEYKDPELCFALLHACLIGVLDAAEQ